MKVNVAAILDFFFWIYSSVTFIPGPLSYTNKSYYRQRYTYTNSKYIPHVKKTADLEL